MTFEQRTTKQAREEQAGEELAAALDALSSPMAERILGRAIELDAAQPRKDTFDYDELQAIAEEVGISEKALRKAILEEFDTEKDLNPGITERITVPRTVRGGLIVDGKPEALRRRLDDIVRRLDAAQYEVVAQRAGDRTLVEVTRQTGKVGRRALLFIALFIFFGPLLAELVASAFFLALAVAAAVGIFGWVKRLGKRVRRSVNAVLGSLLDEGDEPGSWLDLWERSRR
ncbi:MAG: hypothetical protein HKN74_00725 [Acidimicrobiia bacterium]|nr:hypothetical protein [Acidimicrobiia bacterium]MBT8217801.1 hypothetical protein [Acidimicrobiia bacterium]NNF08793.1 hypothetical protein [Acidimicrobiia bacterium]NNL71154.1 hypothetical protein [Acidimicrobiia bacterium]